MKICRLLGCLLVALVFADAVEASYALKNIRTGEMFGPVELHSGEVIALNGRRFKVNIVAQNRVAFIAQDTGVTYGPAQIVDGRLCVIGNGTYGIYKAENVAKAPEKPREIAISAIPEVPEMPERLKEREYTAPVPPKDLPDLPASKSIARLGGAILLVDNSNVQWKLDSKKAKKGSIKRCGIQGEIEWNSFYAIGELTFGGGSSEIASSGIGLVGADYKETFGQTLELGYIRDFLSESGWVASAGLRMALRHDSGDLEATTLGATSGTDENGDIISVFSTYTSSASLTEYALWADLELAYDAENWGLHADFSIQPISQYTASGTCGDSGIKLGVERNSPIAVTFGGFWKYDYLRYFTDITFSADTILRIGCEVNF